MSEHHYAVIMAGGGGTRLWPVSRKEKPKQLLPLIGQDTLFQSTVARLKDLFPPERILVVTVEEQAREMKEQIIADSKNEAQEQGQKLIEQAKAAIESEKNAAMAELKLQVSTLSLSIAEKLLKDELSNKESQTKLVEKMLGDVKLN